MSTYAQFAGTCLMCSCVCIMYAQCCVMVSWRVESSWHSVLRGPQKPSPCPSSPEQMVGVWAAVWLSGGMTTEPAPPGEHSTPQNLIHKQLEGEF